MRHATWRGVAGLACGHGDALERFERPSQTFCRLADIHGVCVPLGETLAVTVFATLYTVPSALRQTHSLPADGHLGSPCSRTSLTTNSAAFSPCSYILQIYLKRGADGALAVWLLMTADAALGRNVALLPAAILSTLRYRLTCSFTRGAAQQAGGNRNERAATRIGATVRINSPRWRRLLTIFSMAF